MTKIPTSKISSKFTKSNSDEIFDKSMSWGIQKTKLTLKGLHLEFLIL